MAWWPTTTGADEVEVGRDMVRGYATRWRRLARRLLILAVALVVVGLVAGTLWNLALGSPTKASATVTNVEVTRRGTELVVVATVGGEQTTLVVPAARRCTCRQVRAELDIWYDNARPPHVWTHDPVEPWFVILMAGLPLAGIVLFLLSLAWRKAARFAAGASTGPVRRYRARWWAYRRSGRHQLVVRCVTLEDVDAPGVVVTSGIAGGRTGFRPETVLAFGNPTRRLLLVDGTGRAITMTSRGAAFDAKRRAASASELGVTDANGVVTLPLTAGEATALVVYRTLMTVAIFVGIPALGALRAARDDAPLGALLTVGFGCIAVVSAVLAFRVVLTRKFARRVRAGELTPGKKAGFATALIGPLLEAARERLGLRRVAVLTASIAIPIVALLGIAIVALFVT